jgi:hypothetical protein
MEGFSRRIAGIRHVVVRKKSVYLLRLLDSNDTTSFEVFGCSVASGWRVLVNAGEFLYVFDEQVQGAVCKYILRSTRMKDLVMSDRTRIILGY